MRSVAAHAGGSLQAAGKDAGQTRHVATGRAANRIPPPM
ncbi:D-inositol 3-phosphate glycosyltransferase 2 [Carbonactinospora thermoautotrophica]|uniref:D-inositol 3-phosphate glycosyltransferase 2 n=1 Tax=Carbonactinospora thermoautotrophica TaxID=1469144 RepID=A0A132MZC5_9ACTN|nr:D-inositol 3-phosphate glycosyltransferase 2 [Carbonactinospora thermoautotrophica]